MQLIEISEIMSRHVTCLDKNACVSEAIQLMTQRDYSCVVISENKIPVGLITEKNLIHFLNQHPVDIMQLPISDVMSTDFKCIHEEANILEAIEISIEERVKHFIVSYHERIAGIVTQSDMIEYYFKDLSERKNLTDDNDLMAVNQQLKQMAMKDHLTEIGNRRAMEIQLEHSHANFQRHEQIYAIGLFDIDYFKKYNDSLGHQAGDEALKRVAAILSDCIRGSDYIFRYGGEEFLIIFSNTNRDGAKIVAERLVNRIVEAGIDHLDNPVGNLTISGGVVDCLECKDSPSHWHTLIEAADECLYRAKENGKNRICLLKQ